METQNNLKKTNIKHLAVIMDGNRRWAKKKNHKRIFGHVRGAKKARNLIHYCSQLQIPFLSLFTLSPENVLRPKTEINSLQSLLEKALIKHSDLLIKEKIKLNILGDLSVFSSHLQNLCRGLCEKTKNHEGLNLIMALNYGGRQEILTAVQSISKKIEKGEFKTKDINEKSIAPFIPSLKFPPPDLIIRTGGQTRLSNFYLWSSAYSEIYFTKTLWPDFDSICLNKALKKFNKTERRYGKL